MSTGPGSTARCAQHQGSGKQNTGAQAQADPDDDEAKGDGGFVGGTRYGGVWLDKEGNAVQLTVLVYLETAPNIRMPVTIVRGETTWSEVVRECATKLLKHESAVEGLVFEGMSVSRAVSEAAKAKSDAAAAKATADAATATAAEAEAAAEEAATDAAVDALDMRGAADFFLGIGLRKKRNALGRWKAAVEAMRAHSAWHDTSEVVEQFGMTQYFSGSDPDGARKDKARGAAAQCMLTNRASRCSASEPGNALPIQRELRRHAFFDLLHPVVLGLWQQRSGRPLCEHSGDKSSAHKVRMVWQLIDQKVAVAKNLTKFRLCVELRLTEHDKRVTRFRRSITLVAMVVFAVAYTVHSLHWVNDGSLYRVKQRVRDTVCGLKNVQRSVVGGGGAPAAAMNGYFDNSTMPLTVGGMMDVEAAVHTGLDICPWVRNAFVPSMYAGHFNSQGGNNASLWRSGYVLDASVMVAGAVRVSQVRERVPGGRWWGAL